jgi:hypothetical protein
VPTYLHAIIWILLGIGIVFVVAVAGITYVMFKQLQKASLTPFQSGPPSRDERVDAVGASHGWADECGFVFTGYFLLKISLVETFVAAWQHLERPTYFCHYIAQTQQESQHTFDFTTLFDQNIALATGNGKDTTVLPQSPGVYQQGFRNISLDEQWHLHINAENYLMDKGGANLVERDLDLERDFTEAIREQMVYLQNLSFWPLRSVYWHFIRKGRWRNVTIEQQKDRRWIVLPNEMPNGRFKRQSNLR